LGQDRRAEAANRRLDTDQAGRPGAWADPYMAGAAARLQLAQAGTRTETGVIVDAVPGAHVYLVSAGRNSFLWCSPGGHAGFGTFGARPLTTYGIGTFVSFLRHFDDPGRGVITGALPHWSTHTGNQPADSIWPFVRTGYQVESAHRKIVEMSQTAAAAGKVPLGSVEVADFSAGRPHEATTAGEWGAVTETGVGVFVDPFQAYLRVDEATGVFASYIDQHLRVAGRNLQMFSSLWEDEHLEDEGELRGYRSYCVYPWEAIGLWRHNQVTPGWAAAAVPNIGLSPGQGVRLTDPQQVITGSGYGVTEPEVPTQSVAARKYGWEGYLGQGGTTLVAGPAQLDWAYPSVPFTSARSAVLANVQQENAPLGRVAVNGSAGPSTQPYAVPPNARGGPDQPGLFSEHVSLPGGLHVRVARRAIISKRVSIPVPRPVKRPEDPGGDAPAASGGTYDPSGKGGAHKVAAQIPNPAGVPNKAIILPDVVAYSFNWEDLHPFAYHAQDWAVAEEGAAGSALVNQRPPTFGNLALQQFLNSPTPVYLDVDHRYGLAPYYETESGIALLDDGSVVIYDGWGSEIRLGSGNIEFRCAGDVCAYPGRNVIAWAGHDVNIKAHDSLDLAAATGDIFVRAEYKFHAVSGNGGCGGFLFENKSICPAYDFTGKVGATTVSSGFTVLCQNSAFLVKAQDIILSLTNTAADGRIFLDAGTSQSVYTQGRTIVDHVSAGGSIIQLFDGTVAPSANEFTEDYVMLGTGLLVRGKGYFSDCLSSGKWITAGAHFASVREAEFGGLVPYADPGAAAADAALGARFTALAATYRTSFVNQSILPPGADKAEFTHRNSTQYRSTDFVYWESRWQTMAAAAGQTLWVWSEPAVYGTVSGAETFAHPGERRLATGSYATVLPKYTDTAGGWISIPRGTNRAQYEGATANAVTSDALDSVYKITTPNG